MNLKTILVPAIVSAAVSIGGFYGNSHLYTSDEIKRIKVLEQYVARRSRECSALHRLHADNLIDVWREIIRQHPSVTNADERIWFDMLKAGRVR